MKFNKIAALFTCALMCFSLTACLEDTDTTTQSGEISSEEVTDEKRSAENTNISKISDIKINRKQRNKTSPMGKDGTWTVFVYMCGSDLESENQMASGDIEEMKDASTGSNVKFVVQTGGSGEWDIDEINPNKCQRWLIQDGSFEEVDSFPVENMGDGKTLENFLKWGVKNYPSSGMGLILWNHGSGSINGVCFDENFDYDSLMLKDIDAALYSVYDDMTDKFDFIGFDACLMATAETAAILATHAKYMVASQDSEPGSGWDYEEIGNYLGKNPNADGGEVGKVICDTFYESCKDIFFSEDSVTLSVVDLGKIDPLIAYFDRFSKELYDMTADQKKFSEIARNITSADNFGSNNESSGYTNMVDLDGLINAAKNNSQYAEPALKALDSAVIYKKNGEDRKNACGLSIYYPLQVQDGAVELSIFKDVCLSSYYLGLVDKIAYGAVNSGDIDDYDNNAVLSLFSNDWGTDSYESEEDGDYEYDFETDDEWEYTNDFEAGEESDVEYKVKPYIDDDGVYSFTLTESSLDRTDSVDAVVFMIDSESDEMVELGYTGEVKEDWDSGTFSDNFDGYWFSLPDGQLLASYLYEECDGYDIYISPIILNGEETYLRFAYDEENLETQILDVWDGVDDESGAVDRPGTMLEDGDSITPTYTAYYIDSDEECSYVGDEYIYEEGDTVEFSELSDSDYAYSFCINDIYGNYSITDPVNFTVDGDDIYFEKA